MSSIKGSQSARVKRPTCYDSVRLRGFMDTRLINGYIHVNILANKLKNVPDETKILIRELWTHPNKKRVRLERLGGKSSAGKGFVIDGNTVVDGLTRRIKDWFETHTNNKTDLPQYMLDYFNYFTSHDEYKTIISRIESHDKTQKVRCKNMRIMDPMRHGSVVHQEMYNAVRYILKISEITTNKQKLPQKFSIDQCTKSCLIALINSDLIPVTSEWPCYVEDGSGCATAIDLICVDLRNDCKLRIIELKTGNAAKALKPSINFMCDYQYNRASMDSLQLLISTFFASKCYGSKFFDVESQANFSKLMGLLYINSSYSVVLNVPEIICKSDHVRDLCQKILNREDGGSLRSDLNVECNTQALKTTKKTIRKKQPKVFKVGFA